MSLNEAHSKQLFAEAQTFIPGGVNSPVRAFKSVGGTPPFIKSAAGAYLVDVDGNEYIDYVGSWGPMILGHADAAVIAAVQEAALRGLSFGAPCQYEVELAKLVCERVDSIDKVRFVSSGTEATMTAIRLARGYTKRDKFIKFEGCYHGHSDSLLVKAGSGALTLGVPSSPGVTPGCTQDTLTATYNDLNSVEALFKAQPDDIAALIIEPIAGNMNMILPNEGFLEGLRVLCDKYGSLLIFDEVMTGFRVGLQGVQSFTDVVPDITTLGKVIGGGMPVGAIGGRLEVMNYLAPEGPVYQAGTLSGNPIAMVAGLETLKQLADQSAYDALLSATEQLVSGILERAKAAGISMTANYAAGMFGLFFSQHEKITRYSQVVDCDTERFNRFFHGMLEQGIYLAPSSFEAGFVSMAHTALDIERTLGGVERVFAEL